MLTVNSVYKRAAESQKEGRCSDEQTKTEKAGRCLDNLPENFQNGERGEEMQNYIEMLDEAYGYLDDANSVIEQV